MKKQQKQLKTRKMLPKSLKKEGQKKGKATKTAENEKIVAKATGKTIEYLEPQ